jgi:hypothetical protein
VPSAGNVAAPGSAPGSTTELVAADAADDVARPQRGGGRGRGPPQQLVAGRVAVLVVHRLQAVEVEQQDRHPPAVARREDEHAEDAADAVRRALLPRSDDDRRRGDHEQPADDERAAAIVPVAVL